MKTKFLMYSAFIGSILIIGWGCTSSQEEGSEPVGYTESNNEDRYMLNVHDSSLSLSHSGSQNFAITGNSNNKKDEILAAISEKQWDLAISLSKSYLRRYPGNVDSQIFIATSYAAIQNYKMAQFFAEMVLKKDPQNSKALNILGVVAWKEAIILEDYRQALGYFNLASQLSRKEFSPALNLAYMQLRLGNLESAWTEFERASKICGGCVAAKVGSALAAQRLSRFDAALNDINEVLSTTPDHPLALYLKSLHYMIYKKDLEEAKSYAEAAIDSDIADYEIQEKARELLSDL